MPGFPDGTQPTSIIFSLIAYCFDAWTSVAWQLLCPRWSSTKCVYGIKSWTKQAVSLRSSWLAVPRHTSDTDPATQIDSWKLSDCCPESKIQYINIFIRFLHVSANWVSSCHSAPSLITSAENSECLRFPVSWIFAFNCAPTTQLWVYFGHNLSALVHYQLQSEELWHRFTCKVLDGMPSEAMWDIWLKS